MFGYYDKQIKGASIHDVQCKNRRREGVKKYPIFMYILRTEGGGSKNPKIVGFRVRPNTVSAEHSAEQICRIFGRTIFGNNFGYQVLAECYVIANCPIISTKCQIIL